VRILNKKGYAVGYIYTPNPETLSWSEQLQFTGHGNIAEDNTREFIVLSRASTMSDPRIVDELLRKTPVSVLYSVYSMPHMASALGKLNFAIGDESAEEQEQHIDAIGNFDTRLYDATTPWGLFSVMMIKRDQEQMLGARRGCVAERITIGRIHVAAFMEAKPKWTELALE
jgi:hypothetical protein